MRLTKEMKSSIINSVMADTKKVDYVAQANKKVKDAVVAKAPKCIATAYKFDPVQFGQSHVYRDGEYIYYPMLFDGAKDIAKSDLIADILKKNQTQSNARKQARLALSALLSGCTTTDMVIAVAPELEPYVPKDAPKKHLPIATGLKDTLKAAGWPK